ncbi:hypothetical protein [Streptomyces sp. NPDC017520]|uniref:hypothetical protein n=1 Tax=Streptomyces sp. NPDC017520 TaxID=3364998 RepID=UPI003796D2FB
MVAFQTPVLGGLGVRHQRAVGHSWDVKDPLADLMAERIREDVRRDRDGGGGVAT